MRGIWPRALKNLIYLWWFLSARLSIQAGDDSWCLVLILRFVLLLSHLPVFLSILPVSLFCLPSMCCGNWHWKLCGQGMGFGFNKKVWLHHLAQQVPALWLRQVSPFELQKYGELGIAIIKRYYSMLYIIPTYSRLLPAWNLPGIPGNKGGRDLNTNDSWRRGHLIVFWLIARLPALEKFAWAEVGIFFMCRKLGWVLVGLYIFLMLPIVNYVKVHVAMRSVFPAQRGLQAFFERLGKP